MAWSEEKKRRLRDLWNAGMTSNQIIKLMPEFSRSAIMGQVYRMDLASHPIVRKEAPPKKTPRLQSAPRATAPAIGRPRKCEWPFGDPKEPGFHYCGAPAFEHRPYCPTHLVKSRKRGSEPKVAA